MTLFPPRSLIKQAFLTHEKNEVLVESQKRISKQSQLFMSNYETNKEFVCIAVLAAMQNIFPHEKPGSLNLAPHVNSASTKTNRC